ncbi:EamA family transporter RarD [Sphingomonas gilva]|uniref:EamA family transporter RarD n=1 Tax=Sphingomonas gilva TaxID=2305907 RepID=UPI00319E200D
MLKGVDPVEIVAQRVLWSLALLLPIAALIGRCGALRRALADRRLLAQLGASSALIAANWLVYVWAVFNGHVLAASLGYFLNPLINVALGTIVLKERLTRGQAVAVGLAALGVAVLAVEASDGLWISLALALSFGLYGLVRKMAAVESLEGLTIETALLAPFGLAYLAWLSATGGIAFGGGVGISLLLVLAGAVTATPLLLFAAAARRIRYSTLGLLQYLAPSIQFVLAITVFGEALEPAQLACFALIWTACVVYALSSLSEHRRVQAARPA